MGTIIPVHFGTYAIGFDVGQTNMRGSGVQNVLARMDKWPAYTGTRDVADTFTSQTPKDDSNRVDIEQLIGTLQSHLITVNGTSRKPVQAVGVAIASSVMNGDTIADASTPFVTPQNQPLGQLIQQKTGVHTRLVNDGDAFTLAEGLHPLGAFGPLKKADKSVLGIVLGTSVGGGLVYKGNSSSRKISP